MANLLYLKKRNFIKQIHFVCVVFLKSREMRETFVLNGHVLRARCLKTDVEGDRHHRVMAYNELLWNHCPAGGDRDCCIFRLGMGLGGGEGEGRD